MSQSQSQPQPQPQTATATYTSIPVTIPAADVISRSIQNLLGAISRHRPWPEFGSSLSRPDSPASALTRLRFNSRHFRTNYILLIGVCGFLSLIGSPGWLLATAAVVGLWLVIYFFREDPLVVLGRYFSDWAVFVGLVLVSLAVVWLSSGLGNVVLGLGIGLLVCGLHGLVRDPEGLFLNENEAASAGLIGPTYTPV
ncbi:PRA1 family protein G2 [Rosa sericea]